MPPHPLDNLKEAKQSLKADRRRDLWVWKKKLPQDFFRACDRFVLFLYGEVVSVIGIISVGFTFFITYLISKGLHDVFEAANHLIILFIQQAQALLNSTIIAAANAAVTGLSDSCLLVIDGVNAIATAPPIPFPIHHIDNPFSGLYTDPSDCIIGTIPQVDWTQSEFYTDLVALLCPQTSSLWGEIIAPMRLVFNDQICSLYLTGSNDFYVNIGRTFLWLTWDNCNNYPTVNKILWCVPLYSVPGCCSVTSLMPVCACVSVCVWGLSWIKHRIPTKQFTRYVRRWCIAINSQYYALLLGIMIITALVWVDLMRVESILVGLVKAIFHSWDYIRGRPVSAQAKRELKDKVDEDLDKELKSQGKTDEKAEGKSTATVATKAGRRQSPGKRQKD